MAKVIIIMDGGIIHNVLTDDKDLDVTVIDYDCEDKQIDELTEIHGNRAYVFTPHIENNLQEIEGLSNMIKDTEEN